MKSKGPIYRNTASKLNELENTDSFNFADSDIDVNEEINHNGVINRAVLLKTNQYSFVNKKGLNQKADETLN